MHEFYFLTVQPQFIESYTQIGVMKSATAKKLANFKAVNLRDFAVDHHGTVDDHPYGGGDGMVLRPEPLVGALKTLPKGKVISLSPSGKTWTQKEAENLASYQMPLIFVCGRFAGVDQRFIDKYVDEEYSLGDFVISGGELAALTLTDSIVRLIPGVLGHSDSAKIDSFAEGLGGILEYPLYTRPAIFEDIAVPDVLMSGDHKQISKWREEKSIEKTKRCRPDLLTKKIEPR